MKFFSKNKPNLIVWDKEKSKRLCKFVNGVYETDNKRIIDILVEDYKYVDTKANTTEKQDLQREAKELKIKFVEKTTVKELKKLIEIRIKRLEELDKEGE